MKIDWNPPNYGQTFYLQANGVTIMTLQYDNETWTAEANGMAFSLKWKNVDKGDCDFVKGEALRWYYFAVLGPVHQWCREAVC